jgi:hypothetical protein
MGSTEIVIGVAGVLVALAAPIIALELQQWLDERHEGRARKLLIFKNLMMCPVTGGWPTQARLWLARQIATAIDVLS